MKNIKILMILLIVVGSFSCSKKDTEEVYPTYFRAWYCSPTTLDKIKDLPNSTSIILTKTSIEGDFTNQKVSINLVNSYYSSFTSAKDYCWSMPSGYNLPAMFQDRDSNFTKTYFNNPCINITKINKDYIQGTFTFHGPGYPIKGEFSGKLQ